MEGKGKEVLEKKREGKNRRKEREGYKGKRESKGNKGKEGLLKERARNSRQGKERNGKKRIKGREE